MPERQDGGRPGVRRRFAAIAAALVTAVLLLAAVLFALARRA